MAIVQYKESYIPSHIYNTLLVNSTCKVIFIIFDSMQALVAYIILSERINCINTSDI